MGTGKFPHVKLLNSYLIFDDTVIADPRRDLPTDPGIIIVVSIAGAEGMRFRC
jgi:hypothetical protein